MGMGVATGCGCTCAMGAPAPLPAPVQAPVQAGAAAAPEGARQARAGAGSLTVASFNVLGSSHTSAGGNKPSFRSGVDRVPEMIQQLQQHDVDVAGLQEFQPDQQAAFRRANTGYAMHGERDNVVVWREDRFRMVESRSITIPYHGGKPRKMPAVLLEDLATGQRSWHVNVHNPADTKSSPRNAANRAESVRREQQLVNELRSTGLPVFLVGDLNDRGVRDSFDGMTAADPQGRDGIDWVFGSGVRFSNARVDRTPLERKVSDHPMVVATATYA